MKIFGEDLKTEKRTLRADPVRWPYQPDQPGPFRVCLTLKQGWSVAGSTPNLGWEKIVTNPSNVWCARVVNPVPVELDLQSGG
ncbi:MAG TPA: hypothetical protein VFO16_03085 [Pseudonocardiaceae bacterium]|nr:hypothetical protein [Pseudonocardiaceae bacterium]